MNAFEQLQEATRRLSEIQAKEMNMPKDVEKLKENVSALNKIVRAILDTIPKEQLEAIKAKLSAADQ